VYFLEGPPIALHNLKVKEKSMILNREGYVEFFELA
jgi:hypothetical protein